MSNLPSAEVNPSLVQTMENGYLSVIKTLYYPFPGMEVEAIVQVTVYAADKKSVVVVNYCVRSTNGIEPEKLSLCLAVMPTGPSGFQRHDKAGHYISDILVDLKRIWR